MNLAAYRRAIALAALTPLLASAQSTDAARYINPQGIEIIQNRPPPPATAVAAPASAQPAPASKPRAAAPDNAALHDARYQVSSKEQAERDRDRLAILRQELLKEMEDYQAKNKILHSLSMQASLTGEQLRRVRETAHAHEQNIRDLNAEISRAQRR